MAKINLPPLPWGQLEFNSPEWQQWFSELRTYLQASGIPWADLNFTGSSLSDIAERRHNQLTSVLGDGQLHVSSSQLAVLQSVVSGNYTPTIVGLSPTSVVGYYSRVKDTVNFNVVITGTAMTSGAPVTVSLPLSARFNGGCSVVFSSGTNLVVPFSATTDKVTIPTITVGQTEITITGTYFTDAA